MDIEKIKESKTIRELLEFGILNIDKPSGPTSFIVSDFVRNLLELNKTSHFGTLDPIVTGVLPIALGRACKLTSWFMKKNKTYVGIMKIHKEINEEVLRKEINEFIGKINQMPPVRSRVKREIREREVFSWDILEIDCENKQVLFKTEVEAGTYIRKLISDLGEKIGGSHMIELRRTKAGIFSEEDANFTNLYGLEKAIEEYKKGNEELLRKMIIPGEVISKILDVVLVKENAIKNLMTGKPIFKKDLVKEEKTARDRDIAVFCKDKFIGVYKTVSDVDMFARAEFVKN